MSHKNKVLRIALRCGYKRLESQSQVCISNPQRIYETEEIFSPFPPSLMTKWIIRAEWARQKLESTNTVPVGLSMRIQPLMFFGLLL